MLVPPLIDRQPAETPVAAGARLTCRLDRWAEPARLAYLLFSWAVAGEFDHLLERRAIGPGHREREEFFR